MELLGTKYGGWYLPVRCQLDENSIVYSVGVGEDISFDILLSEKYNCNIFLVDPTDRAKVHFNEVINFFNSKDYKFTGNIQKDYYKIINGTKPNLDKFKYIDIALWSSETELKFYKQSNQDYVSQSLIENMFTDNYTIVKTTTLDNLMNKLNHNKIDLLKMDIEGAEIEVIKNMLENKIFPKYLLVEFDLKIKNKDNNDLTKNIFNKLKSYGYIILKNDELNVTFEKIN